MPLITVTRLKPDGTPDGEVDINPDQIAAVYEERGLTKVELSSGTLLIVADTRAELTARLP